MRLPQPTTAYHLATLLNADVFGDPGVQVSGLNEIHKVEDGDLTFVDVARYYQKALSSLASVVLINQNVEDRNGKTLIVVKEPFTDYNKLIRHYQGPDTPNIENLNTGGGISKSAQIYPGVYLGNNVTVGDDCILYPNVVLYEGVHLGRGVVVHANTVIGGHAFYYKKKGDHFEKLLSSGRVLVQDHVEIGANCTIDKGVSGDTILGAHSKLDNLVHIAHGVILGERCLIGAQVGIAGKTTLEDDVVVLGQAGISKGLHIGKGATITAKAGVGKNLPAGGTYFGTPAQEIKKAQKELAWLRMQAKKGE